MFNTAKRTFVLMLALVLVFAFSGCKQPVDDGSSIEYIVDTEYIYQDGDSGNTTSGGTTSSGKNPNTSEGDRPSTDKPGNSTYPNPMVNANPEDYRGSKIIFATTIDPKDDGTDYVVSKFEKEYDIDVKIAVLSQGNYSTEMSALIAANKAPTVARSNGDAPIYVGYLQPLDAAQLNYKAELWNPNTFKLSNYNGSPYLCDTLGNFWTEIDMVVYSKSLLKKANCPTPQELDRQGNWTIDSYLQIGKETAKLEGCSGAGYTNRDSLLHMSGGAVYRVDSNNHMVNGIDSVTTSIFKKLAQAALIDKCLIMGGPEKLITNEVAITTTHLWSLRTDGQLKEHPNYNDIGFYFLPAFEKGGKASVTGIFRGWGIVKGCNENPETGSRAAVAGGFFLSEYLDVENYDLNKSFLTEEAKTFFFQLCSLYAETDNYNPYYTYLNLNEGISGMDDDVAVYNALTTQPEQIDTFLKSATSSVDHAVKKLNEFIAQYTNAQ